MNTDPALKVRLHSSPIDRFARHFEIVIALCRREVQSRFGRHLFGYAWTYVAPLIWIAGTYFFFDFFGRQSPVYTDLITFIISGIVPYLAFRMVINSITRVNSSIKGLLIFPSVKTEHGVVASALVEFVNVFVIFCIVMIANLLMFGNGELDNLAQFVFGISLSWGLGASYGYLISIVGRFHPSFMDFGILLLRPSFFFSAVWYTAHELPERIFDILKYNPLLHSIELSRGGMLFHYETRAASPAYVIICIAALLCAALMLRTLRKA